MPHLLDAEETVLEKYKNGADVDPNDREIVDVLYSLGFVKRGLSLERKVYTAITTPDGLGLLASFKKIS